MSTQVILLPGGVMPAQLAYTDLIAALGSDVEAVAKELEMYAGPEPPAGYTLERRSMGSSERPARSDSTAFIWLVTRAAVRRAWRSPLRIRSVCSALR